MSVENKQAEQSTGAEEEVKLMEEVVPKLKGAFPSEFKEIGPIIRELITRNLIPYGGSRRPDMKPSTYVSIIWSTICSAPEGAIHLGLKETEAGNISSRAIKCREALSELLKNHINLKDKDKFGSVFHKCGFRVTRYSGGAKIPGELRDKDLFVIRHDESFTPLSLMICLDGGIAYFYPTFRIYDPSDADKSVMNMTDDVALAQIVREMQARSILHNEVIIENDENIQKQIILVNKVYGPLYISCGFGDSSTSRAIVEDIMDELNAELIKAKYQKIDTDLFKTYLHATKLGFESLVNASIGNFKRASASHLQAIRATTDKRRALRNEYRLKSIAPAPATEQTSDDSVTISMEQLQAAITAQLVNNNVHYIPYVQNPTPSDPQTSNDTPKSSKSYALPCRWGKNCKFRGTGCSFQHYCRYGKNCRSYAKENPIPCHFDHDCANGDTCSYHQTSSCKWNH